MSKVPQRKSTLYTLDFIIRLDRDIMSCYLAHTAKLLRMMRGKYTCTYTFRVYTTLDVYICIYIF